jgi:hypothetical protein
VTGGKPIAVWSQSISGVNAINPLVAFYDIHGRKREVQSFFFPDTTRYAHVLLMLSINHENVPQPLPLQPGNLSDTVWIFAYCARGPGFDNGTVKHFVCINIDCLYWVLNVYCVCIYKKSMLTCTVNSTSDYTLWTLYRSYHFFVSEYCLRPQIASLTVVIKR